jgi:hypothetical protein
VTITAYPKSGQIITTDQYRDLFRQLISSGATTSGGLLPYGDSSGLNVKFAVGEAVIDGVFVKSTSVESRSVAAGSGGGKSRIDTLVANLDFSATPIVSFAVIQGTASASSPAAPSLALSGTVVYRWPIASISVSATASTITSANVTDIRSYTSKEVGLWSTGLRPVAPRVGEFGYNTTLNVLEFHNGSTWGPITPTSLDAGVISTGTISVARGGTGAGDASTARSNLNAQVAGSYAASSHTHSINDVSSLQATLNGKQAAGSYFSSNGGTVSGGVTITDTLGVGAGFNNSYSLSNAVSGQALYMNTGGRMGVGASAERFKKKIADSDLDGSLALEVKIRSFVYDPKFIESDGSVQTGVIAEELVALGLERFVIFNDDGSTSGVHYDKLALLALAGLQAEAKRIDALEVRLAKLEK